MARAAGTSHAYTWKLQGTRKGEEYLIQFPSVTHIESVLKDMLGFGGMAWWGYKIGIRGTLAAMGRKVKPSEVEDLYEDAKQTPWTPNKVRDEAAERGTGSHDLAELAMLGEVEIFRDDGEFVIRGDPKILAPLARPDDEVDQKEWVRKKIKEYEPVEHQKGAARWYLEVGQNLDTAFVERTVWSVRYGFQGTLDYGHWLGNGLEIIDYKSHKPASGMRKDGTYREGEGPAYTNDLAQISGYEIAVRELQLGAVVSKKVVLFTVEGDYTEDTRTVGTDVFLTMKSLHDSLCTKESCMLLAAAYEGVI